MQVRILGDFQFFAEPILPYLNGFGLYVGKSGNILRGQVEVDERAKRKFGIHQFWIFFQQFGDKFGVHFLKTCQKRGVVILGQLEYFIECSVYLLFEVFSLLLLLPNDVRLGLK